MRVKYFHNTIACNNIKPNSSFCFVFKFLITQRKNVEWTQRVLCALPEIDVSRVGVKGAKKYFEAKQPLPVVPVHQQKPVSR